MTQVAVNDFHGVLRTLTAEDPTFERAIAFGEDAIKQRGYDTVRNDPGMIAWVEENKVGLVMVANKRRSMFQ